MIRTRLTELVGCALPIQQAPMGTVSSPQLAVAVAGAGGIGSVNTLAMSRDVLRRCLDEMREQTDGVLAVSFLTNDIDLDAVADGAARARVIDFFWSDPRSDLVDIAHRGGALVNWQVGSRQEALAAVRAGADMVRSGCRGGGALPRREPGAATAVRGTRRRRRARARRRRHRRLSRHRCRDSCGGIGCADGNSLHRHPRIGSPCGLQGGGRGGGSRQHADHRRVQ